MDLNKLFGSKTKVDILKYLLFRRQGISMRALETDLHWTFPAIKKQIDALELSDIIIIDKTQQKRSIELAPYSFPWIKNIFLAALAHDIRCLLGEYGPSISRYFFGKQFGIELDVDLVIVHDMEKHETDVIKEKIANIFRSYFIEHIQLVLMSSKEWDQRYRLADKFVLMILRNKQLF